MITLDAARTLDRSLASVAWADEIVVVDAGSRDETEAIARAHGARVLRRAWSGFGAQKQRAVEAARGPWILSLDADEVVSPALARSIRERTAEPAGFPAFRVPRHTRFLGRWLGSRGWWREWKVRLFRKGRAHFDGRPVHERLEVEGSVGTLEGPLLHDPWRDMEHRLEKHNRYTTLEARLLFDEGRRSGPLAPFREALRWFVKAYLKRGGFLYGWAGLVDAGIESSVGFQREAKLTELWSREGPRQGPHDPPSGVSPFGEGEAPHSRR